MAWAGHTLVRDLGEDAACGAVLVVSTGALTALSALSATFLPRELVLAVLGVGFAALSVGVGAAVARRTTAPPLVLGAFCGAPALVMTLMVGAGEVAVGLVGVGLVAAAGGAVSVVVRHRRADAAGGQGTPCPACDYDLSGLEGLGGCPECGLGRGGHEL